MAADKRDMEYAKEYASLLRQSLGARLSEVILYGSRARGDAREGSDFDLIVVLDERTPEAREKVLDASVEMMNRRGELFAPITYGAAQWERTKGFPLGWNVEREGLRL